MKLTPTTDQVLIEMDPIEQTFGDSDLVRPDIAKDAPVWGTVRGAGPGRVVERHGKRVFLPTSLEPGQRVLVPMCAGKRINVGGVPYRFIREHGINGDGHNGILAVEDSA